MNHEILVTQLPEAFGPELCTHAKLEVTVIAGGDIRAQNRNSTSSRLLLGTAE